MKHDVVSELCVCVSVSSDQPDGGDGAPVHQEHPRERALCGLRGSE